MTNKVCCPKIKVPSSIKLNDCDYLNDILSSLKDITKNMTISLTEASNSKLHEELLNILNIVIILQKEAYSIAWNKGWYILEESEKTKISEKLKELEKKYTELSS